MKLNNSNTMKAHSIHPRFPITLLQALIFILAQIWKVNTTCAQIPALEAKYWYFGTGTRGLLFDGVPIGSTTVPQMLTDKTDWVGFEGNVTVNDPSTGNLLFYSAGQEVINRLHQRMPNSDTIFGNYSGAQTVHCLRVPNTSNQYYLLHHPANDNTFGSLYSTTVDFSDPSYPDGWVPPATKNILVNNAQYSQGNVLVSKPCTNDFWWIGHVGNTNQYIAIPITSAGFGTPVVSTLSGTPAGDSYALCYSHVTRKLAISGFNVLGLGVLGIILADFDPETGRLSNPVQIQSDTTGLGNFSPDGSKLYFSKYLVATKALHQYDLTNGMITNIEYLLLRARFKGGSKWQDVLHSYLQQFDTAGRNQLPEPLCGRKPMRLSSGCWNHRDFQWRTSPLSYLLGDALLFFIGGCEPRMLDHPGPKVHGVCSSVRTRRDSSRVVDRGTLPRLQI